MSPSQWQEIKSLCEKELGLSPDWDQATYTKGVAATVEKWRRERPAFSLNRSKRKVTERSENQLLWKD